MFCTKCGKEVKGEAIEGKPSICAACSKQPIIQEPIQTVAAQPAMVQLVTPDVNAVAFCEKCGKDSCGARVCRDCHAESRGLDKMSIATLIFKRTAAILTTFVGIVYVFVGFFSINWVANFWQTIIRSQGSIVFDFAIVALGVVLVALGLLYLKQKRQVLMAIAIIVLQCFMFIAGLSMGLVIAILKEIGEVIDFGFFDRASIGYASSVWAVVLCAVTIAFCIVHLVKIRKKKSQTVNASAGDAS